MRESNETEGVIDLKMLSEIQDPIFDMVALVEEFACFVVEMTKQVLRWCRNKKYRIHIIINKEYNKCESELQTK